MTTGLETEIYPGNIMLKPKIRTITQVIGKSITDKGA